MENNFKHLADSNNLFHTYLFFGNPTEEFTHSLANYLETKRWEMPTGPLIDFKAAGSKIDDIRDGIKFLWQKPFRSSKKTFIVPNAESLTREAQNAILKIAEEPPEHALLILLVRSPESLLPTLTSRFQKIYMHGEASVKNKEESMVQPFFDADKKKRREILKEICEDSQKLEDFVTVMFDTLRQKPLQNWKVLRALLGRWTLIRQYNVNKRLQLEAALLHV